MMEMKKAKAPGRRVLVTLAVYLSAILVSMILSVTHQIASWVAQLTVAMSLIRLGVLFGWGTAKNGWGWRV